MASEIRVNKIENRSGLGTVTFADTGVDLAGIVTATTFSGSGASLTDLPAASLTGTVADARLTTVSSSKLSGALPALDGSALTGVASTDNIRTNTNATFLQNINVSGTSTIGGAVGINTTVITGAANIKISDTSASAQIEINRTNTVTGGAIGNLNFTNHAGHSMASVVGQADGAADKGALVFRTAGTAADVSPYDSATPERMRITSDGYVTKPNLPYFYATATPSITSNYIHSFGNVLGNNGSHYNNSLGRFVAPVTGFYWFACGIWCNSSSTNSAVFIQLTRNINSSGSNVAFAGCNHRTQYNTLNCSGGTYMVASDYVWIKQTGVTIETSTPRNYFSGYLVG